MAIQNEQSLKISDLFSLRGKTALVTGGSSGLGYMMAAGLLQNGAKVYIASRSQKRCEDAAAALSVHGDCVPLAADVTDAAQRDALVTELADRKSTRLNS